jgi:hypothetical protein
MRDLVADRSLQGRIAGLECIQNGALRDRTPYVELHFAGNARKRPQMGREYDSSHDKVWASTDTTLGRSRTMGVQLSPASADA